MHAQEMRSSITYFALVAVVWLLSCKPPSTNDGREWGYYGDFNRVSNALISIPGITITNVWINRDITLEEFAFHVTTDSGQCIHIGIGESDPLRKMSRPELIEALKKQIAEQSALKTNL